MGSSGRLGVRGCGGGMGPALRLGLSTEPGPPPPTHPPTHTRSVVWAPRCCLGGVAQLCHRDVGAHGMTSGAHISHEGVAIAGRVVALVL